MSQGILVFTDKSIEIVNSALPIEIDSSTNLRVTTDINIFKDFLTNEIFSYILIDSDHHVSPSDLKTIISLAKRSGAPVVFAELRLNRSRHSENIGSATNKSITLSRKQPEPVNGEKEDLRLITETAATLCHEINNPLMTITANIEILLNRNSDLPDEILKKVRLIGLAADRIKAATEKLIDLDSLNYHETIAGRMINIREFSTHSHPGINVTE